jgi:hypothetical protein
MKCYYVVVVVFDDANIGLKSVEIRIVFGQKWSKKWSKRKQLTTKSTNEQFVSHSGTINCKKSRD